MQATLYLVRSEECIKKKKNPGEVLSGGGGVPRERVLQ